MNVALDFDGVVFDVAQAAMRFSRMRWDIDIEPHIVWPDAFRARLGEARYAELFEAVHNSEFAMKTAPVVGALSGIEALRRFTQLIVVTARTPRQAAWATLWLRQHDLGDLEVVAAGDEKPAAVSRARADAYLDDMPRSLAGIQPPTHRFLLRTLYNGEGSGEWIVVAHWGAFVDHIQRLHST